MPTHPGIDIKVTPDREAPIMPNATKYHGALRFPKKKASFPALLLVKWETAIKSKKYPTINEIIRKGDIVAKKIKLF